MQFTCIELAIYIILQEKCKMNVAVKEQENAQAIKSKRINKTNLKNIGFEQVDKYIDPEIGYTTYKFKDIEITVENDLWYCELVNARDSIKMQGVQSFDQIVELKNLVYGN